MEGEKGEEEDKGVRVDEEEKITIVKEYEEENAREEKNE